MAKKSTTPKPQSAAKTQTNSLSADKKVVKFKAGAELSAKVK
jgi:nucleoid DNA-binding protein